jgi:thiopurine S-methyltransferase
MDWDERWRAGRLGFHREHVDGDLERNADWLLADGPHGVLVPLCGKTHDLPWLARRGHEVLAVELVALAVEQFHEEHAIAAERSRVGAFELWRSPGLSVLQGDVFRLTRDLVRGLPGHRPLTRAWDRAALIALPQAERAPYVRLVRELLEPAARVLLTSFEYTASELSGPPFSVEPPELHAYFTGADVTEVSRADLLDSEPRWRERGMTRCESATFRIRLP